MQIAFPINGEGFRFLFRRNNLIQMSRSGTLRNCNPRFKSNYFHSKRMFMFIWKCSYGRMEKKRREKGRLGGWVGGGGDFYFKTVSLHTFSLVFEGNIFEENDVRIHFICITFVDFNRYVFKCYSIARNKSD